ncbi:MAG: glycosyltransferase [Alcanivoracaceae bacterium]|nr:glycosyltransferase [Alcanivoracaceae bacterium]
MNRESNARISVLMPIYNAERFLKTALESILSQSFSDFEIIAINDGSTDASGKILASYGDKRLRVINNDGNKGLIYTLNKGIEKANGKYIARMDADDIALPNRLAMQVEFLEAHPSIVLLGGHAEMIDEHGVPFMPMTPPLSHQAIINRIFIGSCFIHPSVMFRTDVVRELGGYRHDALHAEDYDLWLRIIQNHQVANLSAILIQYRIHPDQVSQRKMRQQRTSADRSRMQAFDVFKSAQGHHLNKIDIYNTPWRRLTGAEPSLGSDHLRWIHRYRMMGRNDLANALIIPGIFSAPLCSSLYREIFQPIRTTPAYRSLSRRIRWYRKKLYMLISGKN